MRHDYLADRAESYPQISTGTAVVCSPEQLLEPPWDW